MTASEARILAKNMNFNPNESEALKKILERIEESVKWKKLETYISRPWGTNENIYNELKKLGYTLENFTDYGFTVKW